LSEFNRWIEALMTGISISNEGQDMSEFIKIMPDDGPGYGNASGTPIDDEEEEDD
jgi:hypothetical protein